MKASELIKELQKKIDFHGDLSVHYIDHCSCDEPDNEEVEVESVELSIEYVSGNRALPKRLFLV